LCVGGFDVACRERRSWGFMLCGKRTEDVLDPGFEQTES
jgi:hypothetical protein